MNILKKGVRRAPLWAFTLGCALVVLFGNFAGCKASAISEDTPMKITFPAEGDDVISESVLARESAADKVGVQHILLAWKDLVEIYGSGLDPRATQRTFEQARADIRAILEELKAKKDWDQLLRKHSEDPVAAKGKIYDVFPKAKLTGPFKKLSLRLELNEVAVVGTKFGFHIVRRLE